MKPLFTDHETPEGWRLTLALLLALTLHAVLIPGLRFSILAKPLQAPVLSLNVTLLAQVGGEPKAPPAVKTITPLSEPASPPPAIAAPPRPAELPKDPEPAVVAMPEPKTPKAQDPPPQTVEPIAETPPAVVTAPQAPKNAPPKRKTVKPVAKAASPRQPSAPSVRKAPKASRAVDLMNRGLQIARSENTSAARASNAREKRLNPRSMTTVEGFYVQAWVRKVEQVGTLNFPEEARRLQVSKGPTLDVAIRSDGSVKGIYLVSSSGNKALDSAARRIVKLASPYAPFPKELRRQYDILHIVRKWKFEQGKLSTK